uniref:Methyltransferase FkbM domain-containing protein n=1 Tax=Panagrolaimus sp. ES5 TaxID=591445 RepID=A0AC34F5J2_9BILA
MKKEWFVKVIPLFFIAIGAIVYNFVVKDLIFPTETMEKEVSKVVSLPYDFDQYRTCLNDSYNENKKNYTNFIKTYRGCVENYIGNKTFDKFRMGRFGEDKVFLPLKSSFNQSKCIWLTVGIGGDDQVEKLFKEKYPECQIFGVEASPDQYANFSNYGTVIPYGVGVKSGNFTLTIRKNESYHDETVKVFAFPKLLDKFVKSRLVQYMTIDIEGFEFGILEALLPSKKLHKEGITFCQIDAELHFNKTKIQDILHKFDAQDSQYLPIWSQSFGEHEKVTWINIENKRCRKAFNINQFL